MNPPYKKVHSSWYVLITCLFSLVIFLQANAQQISIFTKDYVPPKELETKVVSAKLFLDGAQVQHEVETTLPVGTQTVHLVGLPRNIDHATVQVKIDGGTLVSVTPQEDYKRMRKLRDDKKALKDSLQIAKLAADYAWAKRTALTNELEMLQANKLLPPGPPSTFSGSVVISAKEIRKRIEEVKVEFIFAELAEKKADERFERLFNEDRGRNSYSYQSVSKILAVVLTAPLAGKVKFTVQYYTREAGWKPVYDIRITDLKSPVRISLKAEALQFTGIEWGAVPLTFSTGTPVRSATLPEVKPVYLSQEPTNALANPYDPSKPYYKGAMAAMGASSQMGYFDADGLPDQFVSESEDNTKVQAVLINSVESNYGYGKAAPQFLSVEYSSNGPYELPDSREPSTLGLREDLVQATYEHVAYPRESQVAYLVANITNWDKLQLLNADAVVYYNNSNVGKTHFDPRNLTDTLSVGLGVDPEVVVKRELLSDPARKPGIASNRIQEVRIRVEVRNGRKDPITLKIVDQIPLAQTNEIEIKVEELSGGEQDVNTGYVTYRQTLAPAQTLKKDINYTVKWSKGMLLSPFKP